ncbi:YggS family pyridoxal phosphate-dependent enzyme [Deinococcus sp. Marseille-Q6407]|uniref:YggS family pyridoxal phosphate-dependent enzyme n=1 Tax=Deinococcus sp. Marseille-Q6407 TaxID=2969223 RepID=UPI0021BFB656|nr:YggS family pyridoxal phosphate-dependent enzyme [Deinococcus sp. Marseille-Q6407]
MSLPDILTRIRSAEARAGRPAHSARLVAVTKGHLLEEIRHKVLAHGEFPLGENRGQEVRDKVREWSETAGGAPQPRWHYIGPLQSNKVKYLERVELIHTIEDVTQAEVVAEHAQKWGHAPGVLLQVHNGEAQKHGIAPGELSSVLAGVRATGLDVRGLMVMAPYDQPAEARRIFHDTAQRAHDLGLGELSMGMSGDFEIAVEEGATLVRVGSALFE